MTDTHRENNTDAHGYKTDKHGSTHTDAHRFKTDKHGSGKLLYGDLTYTIRGATYDIYNSYGSGQKESVYQKLLRELLEKKGVSVEQEHRINVYSQESGKIMGTYIPDLVVDNKVLIETKAKSVTTKQDEKQLYHYLKNSSFQVGVLVNFGSSKIFIKRIIYTNDRKPHVNKEH